MRVSEFFFQMSTEGFSDKENKQSPFSASSKKPSNDSPVCTIVTQLLVKSKLHSARLSVVLWEIEKGLINVQAKN